MDGKIERSLFGQIKLDEELRELGVALRAIRLADDAKRIMELAVPVRWVFLGIWAVLLPAWGLGAYRLAVWAAERGMHETCSRIMEIGILNAAVCVLVLGTALLRPSALVTAPSLPEEHGGTPDGSGWAGRIGTILTVIFAMVFGGAAMMSFLLGMEWCESLYDSPIKTADDRDVRASRIRNDARAPFLRNLALQVLDWNAAIVEVNRSLMMANAEMHVLGEEELLLVDDLRKKEAVLRRQIKVGTGLLAEGPLGSRPRDANAEGDAMARLEENSARARDEMAALRAGADKMVAAKEVNALKAR